MKSKLEYSRRKFLETTGIGGASLLMGSSYLLSGCSGKEQTGQEAVEREVAAALHKISVQLYTFRNQLNEDVPGTLQKVAGIGLRNVETYDFSDEMDFTEFGKNLKEAGLTVSSMHGNIPLGKEGEKALRRAEAYDCQQVIWHGWPEDSRYQSLDGIKELADLYNRANQLMKTNGLSFGLHNHWWELRLDESGGYPLQTLLEYIDSDIFLEIDTYWVKTAGQDPAEIVKKYGDRVQFMHIKDGPAQWSDDLGTEPHKPMVAVGKGTQDFGKIARACGDDPKWMVIELDECATDVFEAVKDSVDYLTENNLARV
jgi:sugar phosphate isomerase/epimerase